MNLAPQQHAFLLIALTQQPENVARLLSYLKPEDSHKILPVYETLKAHAPQSVKNVAINELKKLGQYRSLSYLADVHSDWVVETLLGETPAMIGTILRYLPAERVRAILDSLPQSVLDQLPRMGDTYQVSPQLVELLRDRFERQFWLHKKFDPKQAFAFEHFYLLHATQIHEVFLEMGYREIALGLASLPESAQKLVMDRLSRTDRLRVEFYLQQGKDIAPQRVKRAQSHLLVYQSQQGAPRHFVCELGYLIFSKSLLLKDRSELEIIKRKMSQADAATLQRLVDRQIDSNSEASVVGYREDLLTAVKRVLEKK